MNVYRVLGPAGQVRTIAESGKWDAANRARSQDLGRDHIDLADVAGAVSEWPGGVVVRFKNGGSVYVVEFQGGA